MPKYKFTPEELKESKNPYIQDWGLTYSFDGKKGPGSGIKQLFADFERNVVVEDTTGQSFGNNKGIEDFELLLNEKFSVAQVAQIKQHYSQGPQLFLGLTPGTATMGLMEEGLIILQPEGDDLVSRLYQENGEIYFKSIATRIPVKDVKRNEIIGYIQGPLEAIFKLDPEQGFALQTLQTDSDFLRDLYQDKVITAERLQQEATNGKFIALLADVEKAEAGKKNNMNELSEMQLFLKNANKHKEQLSKDPNLISDPWVLLLQFAKNILNLPQDSALYQATFLAYENAVREFNFFPDTFLGHSKNLNKISEILAVFDQWQTQLDELPEGSQLHSAGKVFLNAKKEEAASLIKSEKVNQLSTVVESFEMLEVVKYCQWLSDVVGRLPKGSDIQAAANTYLENQQELAAQLISSGDLIQSKDYITSIEKTRMLIMGINAVNAQPDNLDNIVDLCKKVLNVRSVQNIYDESFLDALKKWTTEAITRALRSLKEEQQAAFDEAGESPIRQLEQAWMGELIKKVENIPNNIALGFIDENGINQIFESIAVARKVFGALNQLREQISMLPAEMIAVSEAYLNAQFADAISALTAEEKAAPNAAQQIQQVTDALAHTTALLKELTELKAQEKLNPLVDLVYHAACEEVEGILKDAKSDPDNSKKKLLKQALSNAKEVAGGNFEKLGALDNSIKAMQKLPTMGKKVQGALMLVCGAAMIVVGWFLGSKMASRYGDSLMRKGSYLATIGSKTYDSSQELARSLGEFYAEVTKSKKEFHVKEATPAVPTGKEASVVVSHRKLKGG